jgi:hypothetical protein
VFFLGWRVFITVAISEGVIGFAGKYTGRSTFKKESIVSSCWGVGFKSR